MSRHYHLISTESSLVSEPTTLSSLPSRPAVSTRSHLGQKVVPSAHMAALMHQFQATVFLEDVYSLTAAPRRPLTKQICNDRWLHFSEWDTEQGN